MNNTAKRTVVLASSTYDQNHNQILAIVCSLIEDYGFNVRMPLNADVLDNDEPTLYDEENFLGFITPSYGRCRDNNLPSITHQEIQSAINLNKRRWLLAHQNVVFARQFLRDLGYKTSAQRRNNLNLKTNPASITDLRVIDMYDEAIRDSEPVAERYGNWVHKYQSENDVFRFVLAQFDHAQKSDRRNKLEGVEADNPVNEAKILPAERKDPSKEQSSTRKRIIMVSSTVYGIEELLERIYSLLTTYGYDVWMSHAGTIPVDSTKTAFQNCEYAVEKCDLFLGIITPWYGSGQDQKSKEVNLVECSSQQLLCRGGKVSITHQELRLAIKWNKPRFLLTHENVLFAKNLLDDLGFDSAEKRQKQCELIDGSKSKSISDLRVIDMYEESTNISFRKTLHAKDTFYRFQEVESFIKVNLVKSEVIADAERLQKGVL